MQALAISNLFLPQKYLDILQNILKQYVPNAIVWAYGSRVTGNAHAGSDQDLVIIYRDNYDNQINDFNNLKSALQNSTLPIIIDVHLWDMIPKQFHDNIKEAYIIVQDV